MQNLPITAVLPATSTQAPSPTDNNSATESTEPFGSVLARQRSNSNSPQDSKKTDSNQPGASAASDTSSTASGNEPTANQQAQATDPSGTLAGNMLAALFPSSATANNSATKEKNNSQAPSPDGLNVLPSGMLAMMLPNTAINQKSLQEPIAIGDKNVRPQPIAITAFDEKLQFAGNTAISGGLPGASAIGVNTSKDSAFAAVLQTLGKDGTQSAQLDTTNTQNSAQSVVSAAIDSQLQSGMAPIAASQNGVGQIVQNVINTPVANQSWGNEFNQKITWMASQHVQTAELHLNPPNLGPLDVVLKVSGDQATALFTSPHAAVRDAVQNALPQLRDMLAGNGITLGNAMVSDQSPRDQQAWQSNQQNGNGNTTIKIDTNVAAETILTGTTASIARRHQGMVDTFA